MADVPPAVTTVTSTVPAMFAGLRSTICVAELLMKLAAETVTAPNFTDVALVRPVPVIVTVVPPPAGPAVGLTPVTAGAAI